MKIRSKTQALTLLTMLSAMAILIHTLEPAVPIGIPGVKFGLANAIALICYYLFDTKRMFQLNGLRVLISSLLRGIFLGIGFWLSFSGVLLSSLAMILLRKTTKMSPVGISVGSALFHNIGQLGALIAINKTLGMIYWLPFMLFSAIPTGIITGYVALLVLKRFKCKPEVLCIEEKELP